MLQRLKVRAWIDAFAECWANAPVLSFMLFFSLCAGFAYALAPERPQSSAPTSATVSVSSPAKAISDAPLSLTSKPFNDADLSDRIKTLEERERAGYLAVLDGQHKSIDWWFSFLAIFTTLVGVGGALIPYLMGRKDKELLQSELQNARDLVTSIKDTKAQGEAYVYELKNYRSGKEQTTSQHSQFKQDAYKAQTDPNASLIDKLYAQAVLASEVKNRTAEQADHASELWKALSLIDPSDANAAFNQAYCLHEKFDKSKNVSVNDWQLVAAAYSRALRINPNMHLAAYNWGVALSNEALVLTDKGNLSHALDKWREAGEKYSRALLIKPNMQEAAYNWGMALDDEAKALNALGELSQAREKWQEAGEKFAQAMQIEPNMHDAANNWGLALIFEAKALAEKGELSNAQVKWREAGERLHQALRIKSDKHEAASNWGGALVDEAQALLRQDPADNQTVQQRLSQATHLLEQHAAMGDSGRQTVAYNLARVYSLQGQLQKSLAQLETCRRYKEFVDLWQSDTALANVRASPEYDTWFKGHFPQKD